MSVDLTPTAYYDGTNPVTAAPFTMACWFQPDNITDAMILFDILDTDTSSNYWRLAANGTIAGDPLRFQADSGVGISIAESTTGFSADQWNHACGVAASATSRTVYLNGGSSATATDSRTPTGIDRVGIGANGIGLVAMNGKLAEASVWNVALSAAEVAALARGVHPLRIRPGNIVSYWPLYTTGHIADYIGSSDLTSQGAGAKANFDHAPVQPVGFDFGWRGAFTAAAAGDVTSDRWMSQVYPVRRQISIVGFSI